jgi:hypothetical protein
MNSSVDVLCFLGRSVLENQICVFAGGFALPEHVHGPERSKVATCPCPEVVRPK